MKNLIAAEIELVAGGEGGEGEGTDKEGKNVLPPVEVSGPRAGSSAIGDFGGPALDKGKPKFQFAEPNP
ncbi:hypothetical protein QRD43_06230 [Pelomonas sp. APW6]|uniref:Uncharacterized protein n=1 Tax=Roseateles subflavus TaxID=3053353 RepID=A0ABT7LF70_9BURK|nr:hypothetical protein [Pelomonas sp. APW6]MDL5031501.1 hypothetical protein [Pelomonas sp. APW6]